MFSYLDFQYFYLIGVLSLKVAMSVAQFSFYYHRMPFLKRSSSVFKSPWKWCICTPRDPPPLFTVSAHFHQILPVFTALLLFSPMFMHFTCFQTFLLVSVTVSKHIKRFRRRDILVLRYKI